MHNNEQIALMGKFLDGNMSAGEIGRFRELLHENGKEDSWLELIGNVLAEKDPGNTEPVDVEGLFRELQARMTAAAALPLQEPEMPVQAPVARIRPVRWWGWAAASVLVVALGAGAFFFLGKKDAGPVATAATDITPGRDGAILTLADGSQVVLDSLGNGVVAVQNGARVVMKEGVLAYDPAGAGNGEITYNTLSTPKGRQFSFLLPDGSRVWLNSASSLRYPTVFRGQERRVEITGEAYFEVLHQETLPFRVNINNRAEVEVLGTSFNVNAYADGAGIHTTLLEGKVKMADDAGQQVTLRPGQQARLLTGDAAENKAQDIEVIPEVDTDKVMAWKNGLFDFDGVGIEEVMRQLERWYNIEVVYEKGIPNITFGGKLRRDVSLSGMLRSLEESEVHFRLEGRRVIVTP